VELSAANGGMMRDLSEEGFALRAMMPLRVGDEILFSFLLDPLTRIEGQGEVLWIEENGRVAGVRFSEIASQAQNNIRSWLNDEWETREAEKNARPEADAQSFEMLREELRSAPPRPDPTKPKTNKSKWPVARPQNVPSEETSFLSRSRRNENPDGDAEPEPAVNERGTKENPGNPGNSRSVPGSPNFSSHDPIEIAFEPSPSSPQPDAFRAEQLPRRSEVTAFPKRDEAKSQKGPMLPDISEILMQPPRGQGSYAPSPPVLEPLAPPHLRPGRKGFSLFQALTIMVALVLIVGGFVYRDALGEGLVWLGQQIGGGQAAQAPTSAAKEEAPATQTSPASSTATQAAGPPPSTEPSTSAPESTEQQTNSAEASPYSSKPKSALPSLEKKPPPPVTPLSGISSADTGQEAGSAEYSQAVELLHDGRASDTSEAVRLLWISVEKGNASAELTLAELYWRGQGVARNCDQTGILLGAAARKGNIDAQRRLRQFRQERCE
jgi:PilZ domain